MEEIISQDIFELDHESTNFSIIQDKRFPRPINLLSDFKDFEIINLMLHDMARIQDSDTGMRECKFHFNKSIPHLSYGDDPKNVKAREHIEGDECFITKMYSLLCSNGELQLGVTNRAKGRRNRIVTVEFTIDKVDADIRNKVMGWFE